MYKIIEKLCENKGIKIGRLCREIGISNSTFTELKSGRTKELSAKNALKVANYFGVSVAYLLGETQNPSTDNGKGDNIERFTVFAMDGKVPGARHIDVNMDTFAELNELIKEAQDLPKEKLQALIASAKAMK